MSAESTSTDRLSEVLHLATNLLDRALDVLITDGVVPAGQAVALAKAARLLQDLGVEWPPLLTHVMHELADRSARSVSEPAAEPLPNVNLHGLTRFFAGPDKDKDQQ